MKKRSIVLIALMALAAAACGGGSDGGEAGSGDDLLAQIKADGIIVVSTDPAYPPQSELNPTTNEYEGFDIEVAEEIASRLGVEVQWETPAWEAITSGNWQDRWQMSVGSITVTSERAEVLDFAPAYYFTPASVAVHADNTTITNTDSDLDGKRVGACGGCTYDLFLQKTLEIPGYTFDFVIDDAEIVTYDTDSTVIADLSVGDGARLNALISATPTIEGAIADGSPIKIVGDPIFFEPLAVAFDKASTKDGASLLAEVSKIVEEMHSDGTMSELSMKWYGADLTKSNG